MIYKSMYFAYFRRRTLFYLTFLLVILLGMGTASAEVTTIDPKASPAIILPIEDAQRLSALQQTLFPSISSPLSPNGKFMVTFTSDRGFSILNLKTNEKVAVGNEIYTLQRLTELRWIKNRELVFFATTPEDQMCQVTINRQTGKLSITPVELPGFPLSLSNRGKTLLLVRMVIPQQKDSTSRQQVQLPSSPIEKVNISQGFKTPGPASFDYEDRQNVPVATTLLSTFLYDLKTGQETPLLEITEGTALKTIQWSPKDCTLAMIRIKKRDVSRSGQLTEESPEIQDALGLIPPEENPFLHTNSIDIFKILPEQIKHTTIQPTVDDGAIYSDLDWSPNGKFFITQMWKAYTSERRPYPSYSFFSSSKYRLFGHRGNQVSDLESDKLSALSGIPHMISSKEVLIHTPYKLNFKIFSCNLFRQRVRELPTPDGSIYQLQVSPRKKEIIYNFSSYQQPYELFKLKLHSQKPQQISHLNTEIQSLNKVQVHKMSFPLASGDKRYGYLIQPAGHSFPPQNSPIVVWQQGGPISKMTQEWGIRVESPFNLLPNFGISVLVTPLPGRDGFGPDFLEKLTDGDNFGQIDIEEQVEIINQMVQDGYTSWNQTGITGCSYGGYFAAQSIATHSGMYAAANPQCSLLDLVNEWETGYTGTIANLMGTTPDNEEYSKDSPLYNASNVDTPTLIFAGKNDFLPADLSRQFHDKINDTGTPVSFLEFLDEGHGLEHPTSQFVAAQAQIEWFRYFLQP